MKCPIYLPLQKQYFNLQSCIYSGENFCVLSSNDLHFDDMSQEDHEEIQEGRSRKFQLTAHHANPPRAKYRRGVLSSFLFKGVVAAWMTGVAPSHVGANAACQTILNINILLWPSSSTLWTQNLNSFQPRSTSDWGPQQVQKCKHLLLGPTP